MESETEDNSKNKTRHKNQNEIVIDDKGDVTF